MSEKEPTPKRRKATAGKRKALSLEERRTRRERRKRHHAIAEGDYSALGQIYDREELAQLPPPEALIEDWLDLRTSVVMPGDTGSNKTFAVLGWACSVATGVPWLGHSVKVDPCPVILVVGEGAYGLDGRITAWERHNGKTVPPENILTLKFPEDILDPAFWRQVREMARRTGALMVILDTFSSLSPTADETDDAAQLVRRMNELARDIEGTVVLVHHTGWDNKGRARGGTQLESDPDGVILFKKMSDETATILRKKNKEGPQGRTLNVHRRAVAGTGSCVLESVDEPIKLHVMGRQYSDEDVQRLVIEQVRMSPDKKRKQTIEVVQAEHGIAENRVRRAFDALKVDGGCLVSDTKQVQESGRTREREVWRVAEDRVPPHLGSYPDEDC